MSERNFDQSFDQLVIHFGELQAKRRLVRLNWDNKVKEIETDTDNDLNLTREGIGFGMFAFGLGESQGQVLTDLTWLQTLIELGEKEHLSLKTVLLILSTKDDVSRKQKASNQGPSV